MQIPRNFAFLVLAATLAPSIAACGPEGSSTITITPTPIETAAPQHTSLPTRPWPTATLDERNFRRFPRNPHYFQRIWNGVPQVNECFDPADPEYPLGFKPCSEIPTSGSSIER